VIEDVAKLVERPFAKHNIQIRFLLEPALPSLRASPHHLQQVFMNLLNNARDAMPEGGVITLRTSRVDGYLMAEVEDTGAGIADEDRQRVFEPFFTPKGVGKGTGLGLSVSYGIIRAHGGNIDVRSKPGNGALFRISLPIEATPQ
jgi:two-component system NtrC family sensor kinase